jgi:mannosyltransferase OCH1-like enzyme
MSNTLFIGFIVYVFIFTNLWGLEITPSIKLLPEFSSASYIEDFNSLSNARTKFLLKGSGIQILQEFELIYNNARKSNRNAIPETQIPKQIHQIWLGSKLPEKYKKMQKSIIDLHPGWKYKLWQDKDIENFKLENQKAYDQADNYGEKSDIARYEILRRLGGLYLDMDVECLKPFDFLHDTFDFYGALEPLSRNTPTCLSVANAVIGSRAQHPILKECVNQIKEPEIDTKSWKTILKTVVKTGPVLLTRACYKHKESLKKSGIILPSEFFTPSKTSLLTKDAPFRFCIHHWHHSWMPKKTISTLSSTKQSK